MQPLLFEDKHEIIITGIPEKRFFAEVEIFGEIIEDVGWRWNKQDLYSMRKIFLDICHIQEYNVHII